MISQRLKTHEHSESVARQMTEVMERYLSECSVVWFGSSIVDALRSATRDQRGALKALHLLMAAWVMVLIMHTFSERAKSSRLLLLEMVSGEAWEDLDLGMKASLDGDLSTLIQSALYFVDTPWTASHETDCVSESLCGVIRSFAPWDQARTMLLSEK